VFEMRTTVSMVILLAVSGLIVLARVDANVIHRSPALQDPSPPYVSLVPDQLDFGDQVVGRRSKAKRITVTNTGGKPLYISSVSGDGDNWNDFSVVNDTCTGATVDPNRACIIDVAFAPSRTDERNASLKLEDNAPDSPQTLSLTGNGINSQDVPPFISR
jgi:hypothetical protein